ncbi:hypothetical protein Dvar_76090 [Desulfosarcina variabilis str. Montpellier]|uniref:DUF2889 domain-containing protein n=1 Tax=Desulfosarcina variabilis TaxID=2300 RepID=UPI003AFB156E
MIKLDKTKQQKIHNRKIDTVIYEGDREDTVIVEGELQDRRFCDSHMYSGEVRPPHTVHHMIIRMALHVPELTILDIEVEFPTVPRGDCLETQESLDAIKGMRIAAGFTAKVRKRIDRKKGCTHLLTLLTAMAPAAFQGAWSARIRQPLDPEIYVGMMSNLKNTCWAWRDGGPLAEILKPYD